MRLLSLRTLTWRALALLVTALATINAKSQTLTNGANHVGNIAANTTNTYTFTAAAGSGVVLRISTTVMYPAFEVYAPGGGLVGAAQNGSYRDALLTMTATNAGTYTVEVRSRVAGGSGSYNLRFAEAPGAFIVPPGDEGGGMTNGGSYAGTLDSADLDLYSFDAAAGDQILLRVGTSSVYPSLSVYGPDGGLVDSVNNGSYGDTYLPMTATNAGTYLVVVQNRNINADSGTYVLYFVNTHGSFIVPGGDQGGAMTSGGNYPGTIDTGDMDVYSFDATAGDQVLLRVGTAGIYPSLSVYAPNGGLVDAVNNGSYGDTYLPMTATNGGTYTVVVQNRNLNAGSGTYTLHFLNTHGPFIVPAGDEGGALASGGNYAGTNSTGDLDAYSFSASAGERFILRVGSIVFYPSLSVYSPSGGLVAGDNNGSYGDIGLEITATNPGTYTVVVQNRNLNAAVGGYTLYFANTQGAYLVPPGDEGGAITNGGSYPGTLDKGDLDLYNFDASAGDQVEVRIGTLGVYPKLSLYGPDGGLVETVNNSSYGDVFMRVTATNAGNYTVVAQNRNFNAASGDYTLYFVKSPGTFIVPAGEEGPWMTNGGSYAATLDKGDLDLWSFDANAGDQVVVRVGTPGVYPLMTIYGPNGGVVDEVFNSSYVDTRSVFTATNAGTYTVLLQNRNQNAASSTYQISLARIPGAVIVLPGDQGGPLANGVTHLGTNDIGELDLWTFYGTPGDSNVLEIVGTGFYPHMDLYGPDGTIVKSAGTGTASYMLTYVVTNGGQYTVVVQNYYINNASGHYTLRYSRVPPDLNVPDTQVIGESDTLNVTIFAQDPDVPDKALTFNLVSAPPGVVLTPLGNTNASISWPTTEATGPATNTIAVSVTDLANGVNYIRTNRFVVIVNETNVAPVLTVPSAQTVDELMPLDVFASATDADIPANPLTYGLVSQPPGMTIDANTGEIKWTPSEAQGSNTYPVTVVVTDTNPPAVNAKSLSATNSFLVTVREINTPPQLTVPVNQTLTELNTLNVSASASDSDLPPNPLTFALISFPPGMTINPNTGAIAWTPSEAQGSNTYTVTVTVTDSNPTASNAQHLSQTNSFMVTVNESNSPPRFISVPGSQTVTELNPLNVSVAATDDDIPANPLTYALVSQPSGMTINSSSGAITWTPSEAQGSNFYTITVTVTDTNATAINQKSFTVTTNFTVTVNESNTPPRFVSFPGNQTITEQKLLSVTATATDDDLPANPLTYALLSPPSGMIINASSGAITWTPSEAQGPSNYTIRVTVADTNPPAINQKQFIVTNSFTVTVLESNLPPVLQAIGDQSIHYGLLLSIQAMATDPDIPTNILTFTLDGAPSGMNINASSGLVSWTPTLADFGTNTATVRVTDNGVPPRSDTATFQIVVTGSPSSLGITRASGNLMQVNITGDVGIKYDLQYSTNLTQWDSLLQFNLPSSPYPYVDPGSATAPSRFYRLKLLSQ